MAKNPTECRQWVETGRGGFRAQVPQLNQASRESHSEIVGVAQWRPDKTVPFDVEALCFVHGTSVKTAMPNLMTPPPGGFVAHVAKTRCTTPSIRHFQPKNAAQALPRGPNLFIVGAPKCGTTAWVEYLRTHPERLDSEAHILTFAALSSAYPCEPVLQSR